MRPHLLAVGFDLIDTCTFAIVALVGVLLLGAYQADQAGKRRTALVLLAASVATLIGPLTVLGIALVALVYGFYLGVPAILIYFLVRRWRRRRA